jgi:hypothetical protein
MKHTHGDKSRKDGLELTAKVVGRRQGSLHFRPGSDDSESNSEMIAGAVSVDRLPQGVAQVFMTSRRGDSL